MKNIKKNQSGFTLVELVVVVSLMGIIFGAIMNVVTPTNKFFNETEAFKDEVMISEGLTEALASEVRYSTNVVVLKNYVGVPKISPSGELAGIPNITFDSALMVDNDQVRGAYKNDYEANKFSTVSRRRGAKGQIITFEIGGLGVNFNVSGLLYNETYYSDYQYEFTIDAKNDENGRGYIDFNVVMNDLVAEGDVYVANEDNYESSEFLYLKNINLNDNDGYRLYVKDFGGSIDDSDYTGFERASQTAVTANTDIQRALFDGADTDNVHTWVIYFKGGSINSSSSVNITFDPKEGGAEPITMTAETGKAFNQNPPTFPLVGHDIYEKDGKTYTRKFSGWVSTTNPSETPLTNEQLMAYIPVTDETFYAVYSEADVTYTVTFYDSFGSVIQNDVDVLHGNSITPPDMSGTVPAGYSGYVWKRKGTPNEVVNNSFFSAVSESVELEPHYFNIYKVTFMRENGTTVLEEHNVISGASFTTVPSVPEKVGYTGEWKKRNSDGSLSTPDFSAITGNCTFVPVYVEIAVEKHVLQVSNVTSTPNEWWRTTVSLQISNIGQAPTTAFKITIPMSANITLVEGDWELLNGLGAKISYTGSSVIIDGTGVEILPGVTKTVSFTATPGAALTNGEPVVSGVK